MRIAEAKDLQLHADIMNKEARKQERKKGYTSIKHRCTMISLKAWIVTWCSRIKHFKTSVPVSSSIAEAFLSEGFLTNFCPDIGIGSGPDLAYPDRRAVNCHVMEHLYRLCAHFRVLLLCHRCHVTWRFRDCVGWRPSFPVSAHWSLSHLPWVGIQFPTAHVDDNPEAGSDGGWHDGTVVDAKFTLIKPLNI